MVEYYLWNILKSNPTPVNFFYSLSFESPLPENSVMISEESKYTLLVNKMDNFSKK